jgi:hypothetical protein
MVTCSAVGGVVGSAGAVVGSAGAVVGSAGAVVGCSGAAVGVAAGWQAARTNEAISKRPIKGITFLNISFLLKEFGFYESLRWRATLVKGYSLLGQISLQIALENPAHHLLSNN